MAWIKVLDPDKKVHQEKYTHTDKPRPSGLIQPLNTHKHPNTHIHKRTTTHTLTHVHSAHPPDRNGLPASLFVYSIKHLFEALLCQTFVTVGLAMHKIVNYATV